MQKIELLVNEVNYKNCKNKLDTWRNSKNKLCKLKQKISFYERGIKLTKLDIANFPEYKKELQHQINEYSEQLQKLYAKPKPHTKKTRSRIQRINGESSRLYHKMKDSRLLYHQHLRFLNYHLIILYKEYKEVLPINQQARDSLKDILFNTFECECKA